MQVSLLLRPIPSLDHVAECKAPQEASRAQVLIVCLCLAMLVLRNLCLSSLEVGVAQLAQTHYRFDHLAAGLLCAGVVFVTLPIQLLYETSERFRLSLGTMLWMGLAGGCLLLCENFAVLYSAALVFFPMMVLSSGLVMAQPGVSPRRTRTLFYVLLYVLLFVLLYVVFFFTKFYTECEIPSGGREGHGALFASLHCAPVVRVYGIPAVCVAECDLCSPTGPYAPPEDDAGTCDAGRLTARPDTWVG